MKLGRYGKGFTLIEVVVAVAIVAISIVTLVQVVSGLAKSTSHMRDKVFAQWVANNVMNEYLLATETPAKGKQEGSSAMGGKEWLWAREVKDTATQNLFAVEVKVFRDDKKDRTLTTLNSYVGLVIKSCRPSSTGSGANNTGTGQQQGGSSSGC